MSSVFSHFQDFLQKAYGDDPPAKIPPEVAGAVLCVAGNKGVRTSHNTLTTAGSSKAPSPCPDFTQFKGLMNMMEGIGSMLLKAKELDGFHMAQKQSLAKTSSSESLTHNDSQCSQATTTSTPLHLTMPQEPEKPEPEKAESGGGGACKENDKQAEKPLKGLEEYEQGAFELLNGRAQNKKCMRRPCASSEVLSGKNAKTEGKKEKGQQTPKVEPPKKVQKQQGWGCLRCRGNINGCSTCSKESFGGIKFYSRAEWVRYSQKNLAKGKWQHTLYKRGWVSSWECLRCIFGSNGVPCEKDTKKLA